MRKSATKKKGKAPARKKAAGTTTRRLDRRDSSQRDQLRAAWGIGLLLIGALSALGLYADAAGLVGTFFEVLFRTVFGVFGLLAPLALAAGGVLLLREPRPASRRVVAGLTLSTFGVAGLWHLAAGAPRPWPTSAELATAGGWLGSAAALPLQAVAATWGAAVLLLGAVAIGALIATATPPRVIVTAIGDWVSRIQEALAEPRLRRRRVIDLPSEETGGDELVLPDEPEDDEPDLVLDSDTRVLPQPPPVQARHAERPASTRKLAPGDEAAAAYRLPALDLLRTGREAAGNKRNLDQMMRQVERTLHQFGVDARVARTTRGPTVTRFEVELGEAVKVKAVTKLGEDIAYALATPEIRIVAPIPGKSAIGIEVPNRDRDLITLGDVLRSEEAKAQTHPLTAGLGKDIAGNPVAINLAQMPHLLIAGATGAGKSVTMNGIVTSVLMRTTPTDVRMLLIDPKRVELNHYEEAPHLLREVVTNPKEAVVWLQWTVREMERRYDVLAGSGHRNLDTYNAAAKGPMQPLPYVLVVIDELADLMMVAPRDVESHIVRIAQMARAVGIHLVVATQRPSVDVVTGLIKANIPSRVALAMATQADSRTILDQGGAEKLVGFGDMLFLPANASKPHRIQGCYVDEHDIERVMDHWQQWPRAGYEYGAPPPADADVKAVAQGEDASDEDLVREAMRLVVTSGLGSTSMLQRKLKIGFARAGRLMDELEELGVVGPSEGPKARDVLMTVEELNETQEMSG
jgi:DNA segregation ATPase FtsK/SpoIIIE, S-DNA-T family